MARKMPMRKIAAHYRLSVSRISEIATKHGFMLGPQSRKSVDCERADQRANAFDARCPARRFQHKNPASHFGGEGLFVRALPTPLWTEEEVRFLRRDYGKPGLSVSSIAAKFGRTPNQSCVMPASSGFEVATRIPG